MQALTFNIMCTVIFYQVSDLHGLVYSFELRRRKIRLHLRFHQILLHFKQKVIAYQFVMFKTV